MICFVGGKPNPIITPGNLHPFYGLYDLVRHDRLDGLILCADLAHGLKTGAAYPGSQPLRLYVG